MNFGRSVRIACARKEIKGKDLAELVGVSQGTISLIINNKSNCPFALMERMAAEFEMPVSELIALGE